MITYDFMKQRLPDYEEGVVSLELSWNMMAHGDAR